jgi:hypothetical protein
MLKERYNDKRKRSEWALVSSDGSKILQWFGTRRPNDKRVASAEARVNYYKHKGKKE